MRFACKVKTIASHKYQELDPSSLSRKRWILSAERPKTCSAAANALSIPPGEYARKGETQRN